MPILPNDSLPGLKPFTFHGVMLNPNGVKQSSGDCPFCNRDSKFYVSNEDGKWDCKKCSESGNIQTFLRKLWVQSESLTTDEQYQEFAQNRKLLKIDTLKDWGWVVSFLRNEWIIPGYFFGSQEIKNLYRYTNYGAKDGKNHLLCTSGLEHCLYGVQFFDKSKEDVYLCEGPGDAMALREILSMTHYNTDGTFELTGNEANSMLSRANVIATPSATTFTEYWAKLLEGKRLFLLYDNDYPRKDIRTGKITPPVAFQGMKRIVEKLKAYDIYPKEINYLSWSAGQVQSDGFEYNPRMKSGYDVRDMLSEGYTFPSGRDQLIEQWEHRVTQLGKLFQLFLSVPGEWVDPDLKGRTYNEGAPKEKEGKKLKLIACDHYSKCVEAFKNAMVWHDGLDKGLSSMLAVIASTMMKGDQLWMKIVGPPSCLSEDTFVRYIVKDKEGKLVNKKGGTMKTLYERFNKRLSNKGPNRRRDVDYYIQSINDDGKIIVNKIQNVVCNGVRRVYEIVTSNGNSIKATADHEILTNNGYKRVDELKLNDIVYRNPGKVLPTGQLKAPYRREVLVKYHPKASIKLVGGYTYYRLYAYRAAYEAYINKMSFGQYVKLLNHGDKETIDMLWTIPDGMDVHHLDEDINNNDPGNLLLVDSSAHGKLHSERSKEQIEIYVTEDVIESITEKGMSYVYDIICSDPYRNFLANEIVVHNCGKTVLCDAICSAQKYVLQQSVIRGLYSGIRPQDNGDGKEDYGLIAEIRDKTFVMKDGDTLLQSVDLTRILSELRDVYDGWSSTHFRNNTGKKYQNLRTTFILCGTESLRKLDTSELGERFLDCVIIDEMPPEMEDAIGLRAAFSMAVGMKEVCTREAEGMDTPEMLLAKQLTGGYIEYLRKNAETSFSKIMIGQEDLEKIRDLGLFVSFMRARPSTKQDETAQRELSFRLIKQLTRLTMCLCYVLNKTTTDRDVMDRVKDIAFDTARGTTFDITKILYNKPEGEYDHILKQKLHSTDIKISELLRFLRRIHAFEAYQIQENVQERMRLTKRLRQICDRVFEL